MAGESKLEQACVLWAETRGWYQNKIMKGSRAGWPDRYFLKDGRSVWIEFKDVGEKAKPHQQRKILDIREHGGEAYAVDSMDQFMRILRNE